MEIKNFVRESELYVSLLGDFSFNKNIQRLNEVFK